MMEDNNHYQNINKMFQQIRDFLKPTTLKCNTDLDSHYEASQMEDEFEAHIPERQHKLPSYEHLFMPVQVATGNYEMIKGFKFEFGLPLSQSFAISHTWELPNTGSMEESPHQMVPPTPQKPIYTFTSQLVQDFRKNEPYNIMMGRYDSEGKIHAILIRKINDKINLKIDGGFQSSNAEEGALTAEINYETGDSHTSVKFQPGIFGVGIAQRINKNLIVGFDYHHVNAQNLSLWGYGLKAFVKNHSLFANYIPSQGNYNLGYVIPIKRGTQFVSHYKYSLQERKSSTTIAFKQQYEELDILGTLSSKGEITTIATIKNPTFSLKLCAMVDYLKDKYSFGYGITLGQSL